MKNILTKIAMVFTLALLTAGSTINAQVNTYTFSASAGSFVPLAGGISSGLANTADDAVSNLIPLPFIFNYSGCPYNSLKVTSNGLLQFGPSQFTTTGTNNLAAAFVNVRPSIAPLWDDLQATSGVKYQVSGAPGNRVFTAEWLNMEWNFASPLAAPVISFQVKLYEGTNVIQFIYRQEPGNVNNGSASIGLMGVASSDFISLSNSSASPAASTVVSTNTISTRPATGQVYTFTPPNVPPAVPACIVNPVFPANGQLVTTSLGANLNWSPVAGATGYDIYFGPNPNPPLVVSNQPANTYSTGTLAPSSTYYWKAVPVNCNGAAQGCTEWSFNTPAIPLNDLICNATEITCGGPPQNGTNEFATHDQEMWLCPYLGGQLSTQPGVWYKITGVAPGLQVEVSLCGSSFDTELYIYYSGDGTCNGQLTCVGNNDDNIPACGNTSSALPFYSVPEANGVYYVLVKGFETARGNFVINVTCSQPVSCEDFSFVAPFTHSNTTAGAGDDCPLRPGPDRVYKITIPVDGCYTFSTCSTAPSWDSYIILSTQCCLAGTNLRTNDDGCKFLGNSMITNINLTAGIYYLTIESFSAAHLGRPYTLEVTGPGSFITADITGPAEVLCGGSGYVYSVPPIPGATFNWVIPNGGFVTAGQGTSQITATLGNAPGMITVQAQGECGLSAVTEHFVNCQDIVDPCTDIIELPPCGGEIVSTFLSRFPSAYTFQGCSSVAEGDEQIYSITPLATGTYNLEVVFVTGGATYQYYYKPASLGCGPNGWICIGQTINNTSSLLNPPHLVAGETYYILIDREQGNNPAPIARQDWRLTAELPPPSNPVHTNRCGEGWVTAEVSTFTGTAKWYDAPIGGNLLGTGQSLNLFVNSSTVVYASTWSPVYGCESNHRTAVLTEVTPQPTFTTSFEPGEVCDDQGCVNMEAISTTVAPGQITKSGGTIAIPATGSGSGNGSVANPYPSIIQVSGLSNSATLTSVSLNGLFHLTATNLDIALVSPSGAVCVLMSDVGSIFELTGQTYTFKDGFPAMANGLNASGTYRPTNSGASDNYPLPGPGNSFSQANPSLAALNGNMNGNWKLFIADDLQFSIGQLSSWTLTFNDPVTHEIAFTWSGTGLNTLEGNQVVACPNIGNNEPLVVPYTVTATDIVTGCSGTQLVELTVNPVPVVTCSKPVAPLTNNGADLTIGYGPASILLTANVNSGVAPFTYSWTGDNILNGNNTANPEVAPETPGMHEYCVTVTDSKGCTASACIIVCVRDVRDPATLGSNNVKILVCHVPPSNPANANTQSLAYAAVNAHLGAGIGHQNCYLGPCGVACGENGKEGSAEINGGNLFVKAYPNPFSTTTTISFILPNGGHASLEIFTLTGNKIITLLDEIAEAGVEYSVNFDGAHLAAGTYLYRLSDGVSNQTGKIVLVK